MSQVTLVVLFEMALTAYGLLLGTTLWRRRHNDPSFKWLLGITVSTLILQYLFLFRVFDIKSAFPLLIGLRVPLQAIIVAQIYLFFHAFLRRSEEERIRRSLLYGPVALSFLYYLSIQAMVLTGSYQYRPEHELEWSVSNLFRILLLTVFVMIVLVKSAGDFRRFERECQDQFSSLARLRLPVFKIIWWAVFGSAALQILDLLSGPSLQIWPLTPILSLISFYALVQYAILRSSLFTLAPEKVAVGSERERVSEEEMRAIEAQLNKTFQAERLYLNPDLRLADVAQHLKVPSYKISATLNLAMKTNFFEFVNAYRVEHAQRLMDGEAGQRMNLIGISLDSGFNSKSVFNEAFKRTTKMTPSEFRRRKRPTL